VLLMDSNHHPLFADQHLEFVMFQNSVLDLQLLAQAIHLNHQALFADHQSDHVIHQNLALEPLEIALKTLMENGKLNAQDLILP